MSKKITFILLSSILCTPTVKGMDTIKGILGFSKPKTMRQRISEGTQRVIEAAPKTLESMRAYVQENPGKAGLIGLASGAATEEALTGFAGTRAAARGIKSATATVIDTAKAHKTATAGIAAGTLVTAAGLTDYIANDSAATRAMGRGTIAAGSHVRGFVVNGVMHPRAHYFQAAGLYSGLAAATGLTIDQLAAKGKIRKAITEATKKAGESVKDAAVATGTFVKDGAIHPVANKGKAAIVYGTPAAGALIGTDAYFGFPVVSYIGSSLRHPIATTQAAWEKSEWLRKQAQTFGAWLISNPTVNKWVAGIGATSIVGGAAYLLGRKATKSELETAKKAEAELRATVETAQQELTAQVAEKETLESNLREVRSATDEEKAQLTASLRATEEELRNNTALVQEARRAADELRQQIADLQSRPVTATTDAQTDSSEEVSTPAVERSMDIQHETQSDAVVVEETASSDEAARINARIAIIQNELNTLKAKSPVIYNKIQSNPASFVGLRLAEIASLQNQLATLR
jgi:hypothetical protein